MPRFVFGPGQGDQVLRSDAPMVLEGVDADGTVRVTLPETKDPLVVLPVRVHVVFMARKPEEGRSAEDVLAQSTRRGSVDVTGHGRYALSAPNLTAGNWWVQTIGEFEG